MVNPVWDSMRIERDASIAPVHQIAHSIRHAIATSRLSNGETLPSVRQLASILDITPATIGRAYSILQEEGLLRARSGSATIVADLANIEGAAREKASEAAKELMGRTIDALSGMGMTVADIRSAFYQALGDVTENRYVTFVAGSTPVVEKYQSILAEHLGPLGYTVAACRLEDLLKPDPQLATVLDSTVLMVCMLSFKRGVDQALLARRATMPVSILLTEITMNTSTRLASMDAGLNVLVVAEPEFRNITAGLVRTYLPEERVQVAVDMEPAALVEQMRAVDVVAYTLGCRDAVVSTAPPDTETFLLEYQAREDSLVRIRSAVLAAGNGR